MKFEGILLLAFFLSCLAPNNAQTLIPSRYPTQSKYPTTRNPTSKSPTSQPTNNAIIAPSTYYLPSPFFAGVELFLNLSLVSDLVYGFDVFLSVCQDAVSQEFISLTGPTQLRMPNETSFQVRMFWNESNFMPFFDGFVCLAIESQTEFDQVQTNFYVFSAFIVFKCPLGTFSSTGNNFPLPCEPCPLGTYSNQTQSTMCHSCSESSPRTLQTASTSIESCLPCPLGSYCPIGSTPQFCPLGFYEPSTAQLHDRRIEDCVQIPCADRFFWCGLGAANGTTYVPYLHYTDLSNVFLLKSSVKVVPLLVRNVHNNEKIFVRLSTMKNPAWISSSEYIGIDPGFSAELMVEIDATFMRGDVIQGAFYLEWYVSLDPFTVFYSNSSISGFITAPVVSPRSFLFNFNIKNVESALALMEQEMEVTNTLCNNSITVELFSTCKNKSLEDWILLPSENPFAPVVIEQQRGLPEVIPFRFNLSHAVFDRDLFIPIGTSAPRFEMCFAIAITLNGLDASQVTNVPLTMTIFRDCPPGSVSPIGDDRDSCDPCKEGYYQERYGQTFCTKCPSTLPRTLSTGSISMEQCLPSEGGYLGPNRTVIKCPEGAICDEVGMTVETIKLAPFYWRSSVYSPLVLECFAPQYCVGGQLVEVNLDGESSGSEKRRRLLTGDFLGGNVSTDGVCVQNHTGPFCFNCASGMVKRGVLRFCGPCEDADYVSDKDRVSGVFLGLGFALCSVLLLSFLASARNHRIAHNNLEQTAWERKIRKIFEALDITIPVQITIGFLQVTGGMSGTFQDLLPPFFQDIKKLFGVLALDLVQVLDFGCTLEAQNHFTSLLLTSLLPIGFVLFLWVAYFILTRTVAKYDKLLRYELRTSTFNMFLVTLFLVYPTCGVKILGTFACKKLDTGVQFLVSDPGVNCLSPEYQTYFVFALFMTVLYPVGIPVLYFVLLSRERTQLNPYEKSQNLEHVALLVRENNREIRYLRFLWKPYKTRFYWFEVFELLRKLGQTSVVVFVASGSSGQIIFQLLVTTISVVVLNSLLPYTLLPNNMLALLAQYAIFGICMTTLLTKLNRYTVGIPEYSQSTLDSFLIFFFLVVPVGAILSVLYHVMLRNQNYRSVICCVDWEKMDRKLARMTLKRKFAPKEPHLTNLGAFRIKEEKDILAIIPKDFKESMDTLRKFKDHLQTVRDEFKNELESEHLKLNGFAQDRDTLQQRNLELEAEVERNRLLIANLEDLEAKQEAKAQNAEDLLEHHRRTTVHHQGGSILAKLRRGSNRPSNLGAEDLQHQNVGVFARLRRMSHLPESTLGKLEAGKQGEALKASSLFSNSIFARRPKEQSAAVIAEDEETPNILFVREQEQTNGTYLRREMSVGSSSNDAKNLKRAVSQKVVKEKEKNDGTFEVGIEGEDGNDF